MANFTNSIGTKALRMILIAANRNNEKDQSKLREQHKQGYESRQRS